MRKNKIVMLLVVCLLSAFVIGCASNDSSQISVPASASDLEGKNYKTVVKQLKDAGFTKINVKKDADLIAGFLHKEGDVKSVTIAGHDDFSTDDSFSKKAQVRITYHTFPEKKSSSSSSSSSTTSSTTSSSENTSSSSSSSAEKASYTIKSRREKNEIFILGSITLIGHDPETTSVKVGEGGLQPGTYTASWEPGILNGSDPDYAYGVIILNNNDNTSYPLYSGETSNVKFTEGDTVTFKLFGKGDADHIDLQQQ